MKRKLVSYNVFEGMINEALSTSEAELIEAAPILAEALGVDSLELLSYGPEDAMYDAHDGTYVHTGYQLNKDVIKFENIEQIAVDDETEAKAARDKVSLMLDSILEGNSDKADATFNEYISLARTRRSLNEGLKIKASVSTGRGRKSKFRGKRRAGGRAAALKAARTRKEHEKSMGPGMKNKIKRARDLAAKKLGGRTRATNKGQRAVRPYVRVTEWIDLCTNVVDYVDYVNYGPVLKESTVQADDQGNVVSVTMPTINARNEAKLLSFNWKTMDTDVKVLRSKGKCLCENNEFCKASANLKRQNAVSDSEGLNTALETVVTQWPEVLYLTEKELSSVLKCALTTINAKNFDDQTCAFMAEGILRTAHAAYTDRVAKIINLSGASVNEDAEDKYAEFKKIVDTYYVSIDETTKLEMQMFVDLYETLREIHNIAVQSKDAAVAQSVSEHLDALADVIRGECEASVEIAEAATEWLVDFTETNLETIPWDAAGMTPDNTVTITTTGDHPRMAMNAKKSYSPAADFSGNWGDPAPVSDGKNYKGSEADDMRNRSWGNYSSGDTYPELKNPYVPSAQVPKIQAGKVDTVDDDGLVYDGGNDTWPALQNPYVPSAPDVFKMKGEKGVDQI